MTWAPVVIFVAVLVILLAITYTTPPEEGE